MVDGTDGDTYLNSVAATFLQTSLTARGAIVGAEGVKGKTDQPARQIDSGRVEDVLRLGVKGDKPVMTGALALHADMNLPAGPEDVMDRLQLTGTFQVTDVQFHQCRDSRQAVRSQRTCARPQSRRTSTHVASNLHGQFRLPRTPTESS